MTDAVPHLIDPDYSEWQRLLAEAFFSRPGVPVVIFAADDELDKISPAVSGCTAAEALAHAVLPFARLQEKGNMFASLRGLRTAWRRADGTGPPPTLPLLALTVLAATRMRGDDQASAANYYLRMAQALLPGGDAGEVQDARAHMLAAFERDVAPMWRELHDWLVRERGQFGVSTVRAHPVLTNIGFPLSQALVRASDKALLTRFFSAIDVVGCGVPSEGALLGYLRLWAVRHRALSGTLRSALEDEALWAMVGPIVAGLAASWDGRVVTPEGRRRLELKLVLNIENWRGQWVVAGGNGIGPVTLSGKVEAKDFSVAVRPAAFGGYGFLTGAPAPTRALVEDGFKLDGRGVSAEFAGTRLAAMRQDADAGGWVSFDSMEPYSEHVLAVHRELSGTVGAVLAAAADDGWRPVLQKPGDALLDGFAIFRRVRFSDPVKLDDALSRLPDTAKRVLRPAVTARPRLSSGLPLARSVAPGCYLAGGEPDLLLPVAADPRQVLVAFDGAPQNFKASGFPIPLAVLPGIELGDHVVEADGEVLRFTVMSRSPADENAVGTGELAWDVTTGLLGKGCHAKGICGVQAPACDADAEPLLVRRGASESWWLHRDGACTASAEPALAPFLEAPGLRSLFYEAKPPGTAAWLVQKRRQGWAAPTLLRRLAPEFRRVSGDTPSVWPDLTGPASPVLGDAEAGLWALYTRAWALTRER